MKFSLKTTRVSIFVVIFLFIAWIFSLFIVWYHRPPLGPNDPSVLQDQFGAVVPTVAPAVVAIEAERNRGPRSVSQSIGSGFIIDPDGFILTNEHVINDADDISVVLADKRKFIAQLIADDPRSDIAVIKIDADNLPALDFAPPGQLRPGQVVITLGNPFGAGADGEAVVTYGHISRLNQKPNIPLDREHDRFYDNLIMSTAATLPGSSGGPLINIQGQVIGITTAMGTVLESDEQFGFAIAFDSQVLWMIEQLIAGKPVEHAFIGIRPVNSGPETSDRLGINDISGALVSSVLLDTPAQKAGIRREDLIRSIDGRRISNDLDFISRINRCQPGQTVNIGLLRGDDGRSQELNISVELGARSQTDKNGYDQEDLSRNTREMVRWGMEIKALIPWRRQKMNLPPSQLGVLVYYVQPGSPADRQNIEPGDLIIGLGRFKINNLSDFDTVAPKYRTLPPEINIKKPNTPIK